MSRNLVLLDTNVFSLLFVGPRRAERRGYPVDEWRARVSGHRVLISFQTRAEVLFGALKSHWGAPRLDALDQVLSKTPTVWVDDDVVRAEATLRMESLKLGHPLAAREHTGDRWIGACAVAKGLPLWSLDNKAFRSAPLINRFDASH